MSTPMTWQEFERFARVKMSEHFGAPLREMQGAGLPKRFDLVSEDRSIVGDAKYLTLVHGQREPPAKLMEITGHVWLLEKTRASRRFIVFGNQVEVAQLWLVRYGNLPTPVEFYFLRTTGKIDRLVPPDTSALIAGKYEPLRAWLLSQADNEVSLTFAEIEDILADELPASAHQYEAWWGNEDPDRSQHVQCRAWRAAGWRARPNLSLRIATFRKD
jgi:hypothetical protein